MRIGDRVIIWYGIQFAILLSVAHQLLPTVWLLGVGIGLLAHIGVSGTTLACIVANNMRGLGRGWIVLSFWFTTNITVGLVLALGTGSLSAFTTTVLSAAYLYSCFDACLVGLLTLWSDHLPIEISSV